MPIMMPRLEVPAGLQETRLLEAQRFDIQEEMARPKPDAVEPEAIHKR
jgi:hypothetical protein